MSRRFSVALACAALTLLAACDDVPTTSVAAPGTAPLLALAPGAEVMPGRYIVVFRDDVRNPASLAAQLAHAHGGELHYTYRHALKGFAATLSPAALEGLRHNPNVAYVQHDQVGHPLAYQTPAPWALDRVDQRALPRNDTFTYNYDGRGVRVYIIDSGIDVTHPEFGGRATLGYDACFRGCFAGDGFGHGTQVAGFVGAATYGVAKGVSLISVRVYSNRFSPTGVRYDTVATTSTMTMGVDWVTGQKLSTTDVPMVANISSIFAPDAALDAAVRNSIAAGVTYVIGAGNRSEDACYWSPQRVTEALTVGGIDRMDYMTTWSARGPCVDLYAPASVLTSTAVGGGTATNISGTSFAAPQVAGFAAQYLQPYWASSPASVHSATLYYTTKNAIINLGANSHNRLLFTNWVSGQSGRPPGCCL